MSLCRPSVPGEAERLKTLWKLCFGDEDSYIDHYFRTFYTPERTLVLEAEGQVQSMLLTFPETLTTHDGSYPACYIYAFCTHPDAQSKGYGRTLLRYAEERAHAEGCAATLMVPGEESLFRFYETLGYTVILPHRVALWQRATLPLLRGTCSPLTAEEYARERTLWLTGMERVDPAQETLAYQRSLCRNTGGGFYRLGSGIAAVELWEGTAEVKELLCADWKQGAAELAAALGAQEVRAYLPADATEGTLSAFCVLKPLSDGVRFTQHGYFPFAFD